MAKKKTPPQSTNSEILIYQSEDGENHIQVRLEEGTVWLSQKLMAKLFQTTKQNIRFHIQNIFNEEELSREATVKKYFTVRREGSRNIERAIDYYNLEVILAVGYRVKSSAGTRFRRWATERLNEYLVKGFTMNDERLKSGYSLGVNYFDELMERIRDIRSSEKRFYQKIRDI